MIKRGATIKRFESVAAGRTSRPCATGCPTSRFATVAGECLEPGPQWLYNRVSAQEEPKGGHVVTTSEPTVFIIDDDPSARRGVTRLVRAAGLNAESFTSAGDFLASGRTDGPGCIVLDVRMPEMTGPELQTELGRFEHRLPIIFLSGHADVPITARAMKDGAVDFLTKPVDRDDLLAAIRASLDRDAENRTLLDERADVLARVGTLTPREHEVMTWVITGLLNKQIAGELDIAEDTVKIHRGRVMKKLGVVSVADLVRLCGKAGIAPAAHDQP